MTRKTYIAIPVSQVLLGGSHVPAECCKLKPHVTLHHCGDGISVAQLERIIQAVRSATHGQGPMKAELTGLGSFLHAHLPKVNGRHPSTGVVLVNSRPIVKLWARLDYFLAGAGIKISEKYGFIPHVALETLKADNGTAYWMADFVPRTITLGEVHVVSKDKTKQLEQVEVVKLEVSTTEETLNRFAGVMANIAPHDRLDTSDVE
jgi:2'-5' RNA ligase